jgi:hypothetical protein
MVEMKSEGELGSRRMELSLYSPKMSCPTWIRQYKARGVSVSSCAHSSSRWKTAWKKGSARGQV